MLLSGSECLAHIHGEPDKPPLNGTVVAFPPARRVSAEEERPLVCDERSDFSSDLVVVEHGALQVR